MQKEMRRAKARKTSGSVVEVSSEEGREEEEEVTRYEEGEDEGAEERWGCEKDQGGGVSGGVGIKEEGARRTRTEGKRRRGGRGGRGG